MHIVFWFKPMSAAHKANMLTVTPPESDEQIHIVFWFKPMSVAHKANMLTVTPPESDEQKISS